MVVTLQFAWVTKAAPGNRRRRSALTVSAGAAGVNGSGSATLFGMIGESRNTACQPWGALLIAMMVMSVSPLRGLDLMGGH